MRLFIAIAAMLALQAMAQTDTILVRVPAAGQTLAQAVTNAPARTNVASGLVAWVGANENTNAIPLASKALEEVLAALGSTNAYYLDSNPSNYVSESDATLIASNAVYAGTNGLTSGGVTGFASTNYVPLTASLIEPYSNGTNYWLDYGLTNSAGAKVYQSVLATNDVWFTGTQNGYAGAIISVNVLADGGARSIGVPSWANMDTNGMTLQGDHYVYSLPDGKEFRLTVQSNAVSTSVMWAVPGAGVADAIGSLTNGWTQQPTNTSTDGYAILATGAKSKWVLPPWLTSPTNSAVDGYVVMASGDESKWALPPAGVGSNSVVQSLYQDSAIDFGSPVTATVNIRFRTLGDNIMMGIDYTAGSTANITLPSTSWVSSDPYTIEQHKLVLTRGGTGNVTLGWPSAIFANGNGSTNPPALIAPGQAIIVDVMHVGGHTNWIGGYRTVTNANAFFY